MNRLPKIPYRVKKLTCALAAFSIIPSLWAAPEQGQVMGGQGSIEQHGKNTLIQQASERLSINWQNFDVNSDERVQFIQPHESSIAFNRILSNKGSLIQGRIDANGQVVLINPNGIIFTDTASVNVGALVASGLDINQEDFLNSQFTLNALEGAGGQVINSGLLTAATGGSINLLGTRVENNGLISANLGSVNLAAGKEAVLTFERDGLIGVRISQAVLQNELGVDAAVVNTGEINAQGGKVLLTASVSKNIFSQAVNVGELSPAKSVVVNADGSFSLGAGADVVNSGAINVGAGSAVVLGETITHTGQISADSAGNQAGSIELNAAKTTLIQGKSRISATAGKQGTGGDIKILGQQVGLLDDTQVDASGADGGGHILVGGDTTGANSLINNAEFAHLGEHTQLSVDTLHSGSAGKLIIFAEDSASIYGHLSARGGAQGDGGFVETSGLQSLDITQAPDISAAGGKAGHWLIDPYNIEIVNSAVVRPDRITTRNTYSNSTLTQAIFTSRNDTAQIGWNTIRNVLDNGSGGTVEIKTSGGSNAGGTIKVAANFDFSSLRASAPQSGFNSTLVLTADKNIEFTDSVTYLRASANNRLNLNFNAQSGINFNRATIATNGGNLSARTQNGAISSKASLNTARSGDTNNNSGKIHLSTATGSIALNAVISAGTSVFNANGRGGNAGAIDLQANQGSINIGGVLSNTAGNNRVNTARHGAGAALNLAAANITTHAINTSANNTSITASEQVSLGAFNSNSNCAGLCSGDLIISAAPADTAIDLTQSAAWQVKGKTQLNLGATGNAVLTQAGNKFGSAGLKITAQNTNLVGNADLFLADITTASLTLSTPGAINQLDNTRVKVDEAASLAGTSINLSAKDNDFNQLINLKASEGAVIADANGLSLNNLSTTSLKLNTQGEVQLGGELSAQAPITISQEGAGAISLMDGLSTTAAKVSLVASSNLGTLNYWGSEHSIWNISTDNFGALAIGSQLTIQFSGFNNLNAGAGGQLIGPNAANNWDITGQNAGRLNTLQFSGMSTLIGGNQRDQFTLTGSGYITERISGGDGADTIASGFNVGGDWYIDASGTHWLRLFSNNNQYFAQIENLNNFTDGVIHGPAGDNSWQMTGIDRGVLNGDLSFSGITILVGNTGNDRYIMGPGRVAHDGIADLGGLDELVSEDPNSIWTLEGNGRGAVTININSTQSYPVRFGGIDVLTGSTNQLIGPNTANSWELSGINSGRLNTMTFSGMNVLTGGNQTDGFTLTSGGYISGSIQGGEGLDTLETTLNVGGDWYLDAADNNWLRLFMGSNQYFSQIENLRNFTDGVLHGPAGTNTWRLTGIDRGTLNDSLSFSGMTILQGNTGNDRYLMGANRFAHDGISDLGGRDELVAEDAGSLPNLWSVTGPGQGRVSLGFHSSQLPIYFSGIERLTGANNDVLTGPTRNNTWYINALNSGTLNNTMAFSGMNAIVGNSLDDRITVGPGGLIADGIAGAAGRDTLSVDAFEGTSWSIVSERQGLVSTGFGAISQAFSDIEVIMGDGNSSLTGPNTNNNWRITANNAGTLNDSLSFSGINLLRGNSGNDHFEVSGFVTAEGLMGAGGFDSITALGGPTEWTLSNTGSGWLRYLNIDNYLLYFSGIEAIQSN